MNDERWQWNAPNVTSEQFDDEVVVVNFESGKYHSIQGDGVTIWRWLEHRLTLDELVALALDRFDGDPHEVEQAVRSFVVELGREELAIRAPLGSEKNGSPAQEELRAPFRAPALTTFSDMQELLWLDPIHEVDESGWPLPRNDTGN